MPDAAPGNASAAGWHGKLPALGDFASRRLDPEFVEAWDHWLSSGLAAMRQEAAWPDAYLSSPSWRFVLMPGFMPGKACEYAWVGVLMPSVDRVGRYYPLTLAHPLARVPAAPDELGAIWRWMVALDNAAADALHEDWSLETFEAELARIGVPQAKATPAGTKAAPAQSSAFWAELQRGQSRWYAEVGMADPTLRLASTLSSQLLIELLGATGSNQALATQGGR